MFPEIHIAVSEIKFDSEKYTKDVRVVINQAFRFAARAFVLAATSRIPIRTGFLRGAYGNLEDVVGYVEGGKVVATSSPRVRKKKIAKSLEALKSKAASRPTKAVRRKQIQASLPKGQKREGATKILKKEDKEIAKEKSSIARLKERLTKMKKVAPLTTFGEMAFKQNEYYYVNPVGHAGKRRGVIRGNPILKTTTSGKPFATPSAMIYKPSSNAFTFTFGVDIRYYGPNELKYGWYSQRAGMDAFVRTFANHLITRFPAFGSYITTERITEASHTIQKIPHCGDFITTTTAPRTVGA